MAAPSTTELAELADAPGRTSPPSWSRSRRSPDSTPPPWTAGWSRATAPGCWATRSRPATTSRQSGLYPETRGPSRRGRRFHPAPHASSARSAAMSAGPPWPKSTRLAAAHPGGGEEAAPGDVLVGAGLPLTPPRIALAAATGYDVLSVIVPPAVRLLVLGDEVIERGTPIPGRVRDVFSPSLPAVLGELGTLRLGYVGDSFEDTIAAFRDTPEPLLVTTGGSARGPADHVRASLHALGAELLLDGIRMRPGHPLMLARLASGTLVLSLPGNPLAAYVGLVAIGGALVDGMLARPLPRLTGRRSPRPCRAVPRPGWWPRPGRPPARCRRRIRDRACCAVSPLPICSRSSHRPAPSRARASSSCRSPGRAAAQTSWGSGSGSASRPAK